MAKKTNLRAQMAIAVLVLLAGLAWTWTRTGDYVRAEINSTPVARMIGGGPGGRTGMPNPSAMRERLRQNLKLTDEQVAAFEAEMKNGPPKSPEDAKARFQKMRQTLTTEQQERMKSTMRDRILNSPDSPARNLSPEDRAKFAEKLEQRLESGDMMMMGPPPGMRRP